AALAFASRKTLPPGAVSDRAVSIAEAVLWTEAAGRLKLMIAMVVLLSLAGGGAGAWFLRPAADGTGMDASAPVENPLPQPDPKAKPPIVAEPGADAGDRLTYSGQVLDPERRPRAGAGVSLVGTRKLSAIEKGREDMDRRVLAETRAD